MLYEWFPQQLRMIQTHDGLLHASGPTELVCGKKAHSYLASKEANAAKLTRMSLALLLKLCPENNAVKPTRKNQSKINFVATL